MYQSILGMYRMIKFILDYVVSRHLLCTVKKSIFIVSRKPISYYLSAIKAYCKSRKLNPSKHISSSSSSEPRWQFVRILRGIKRLPRESEVKHPEAGDLDRNTAFWLRAGWAEWYPSTSRKCTFEQELSMQQGSEEETDQDTAGQTGC